MPRSDPPPASRRLRSATVSVRPLPVPPPGQTQSFGFDDRRGKRVCAHARAEEKAEKRRGAVQTGANEREGRSNEVRKTDTLASSYAPQTSSSDITTLSRCSSSPSTRSPGREVPPLPQPIPIASRPALHRRHSSVDSSTIPSSLSLPMSNAPIAPASLPSSSRQRSFLAAVSAAPFSNLVPVSDSASNSRTIDSYTAKRLPQRKVTTLTVGEGEPARVLRRKASVTISGAAEQTKRLDRSPSALDIRRPTSRTSTLSCLSLTHIPRRDFFPHDTPSRASITDDSLGNGVAEQRSGDERHLRHNSFSRATQQTQQQPVCSHRLVFSIRQRLEQVGFPQRDAQAEEVDGESASSAKVQLAQARQGAASPSPNTLIVVDFLLWRREPRYAAPANREAVATRYRLSRLTTTTYFAYNAATQPHTTSHEPAADRQRLARSPAAALLAYTPSGGKYEPDWPSPPRLAGYSATFTAASTTSSTDAVETGGQRRRLLRR
ncbi:RHTO0S04e05116g1_1 [Rhodotorula toruloides]|uniref:RHTO0S04e05116g1_1 n=2 Tax=Rhodotorula toruloides TaxID=5286 RepID=A0A061APG2_RHOTO|nr:uncharacterized protein RHTO_01979 [Rhodotorula toruloides NP11]EMS21109.1 hypothetical protein RHTO_01979 [Rhodotorula toruloides NP11]CDR39438.1 RHTO0S04e05116g1_1 [Rhodotorula toruloides]